MLDVLKLGNAQNKCHGVRKFTQHVEFLILKKCKINMTLL